MNKEYPSNTVTEYLCYSCKQLRLSLVIDKDNCHNCGSIDIVTGLPGELDKEILLKKRELKDKKISNGDKR